MKTIKMVRNSLFVLILVFITGCSGTLFGFHNLDKKYEEEISNSDIELYYTTSTTYIAMAVRNISSTFFTGLNMSLECVYESGNIIRLFGIDSPELSQTCTLTTEVKDKETEEITIKEDIINCGLDAKLKLSNLVKNIEVKCYIKGKDAYDRFVGECGFQRYNRRSKRTDKININKEMILSGNAVAFTQISEKYVEDENRAKAENRGIWTMTFDMPSVYRKKNEK